MCNCDSPWVRRANDFLSTNQGNPDARWHTLDFLIQNNRCGINNRTSIENILNHLSQQGINIDRETFQQTILGELKRQGIVATLVYPGPEGGVFIPCSEDEVRQAARQIVDRVYSEVLNIEGLAQGTSFEEFFSILRQIIDWIRRDL